MFPLGRLLHRRATVVGSSLPTMSTSLSDGYLTWIDPLAGQPVPASMLIDRGKPASANHSDVPDPTVAAQRVAFGTSGHRGSAFDRSFNRSPDDASS